MFINLTTECQTKAKPKRTAKREEESTIIVEDSKTPISEMETYRMQKSVRKRVKLNNLIHQLDRIHIY